MSDTLIHWMDLTRLESEDSADNIAALCTKAHRYRPAAVCVYPQYVRQACAALSDTDVAVATVANFPSGMLSTSEVCAEIRRACADGAQEIDVVIPYGAFIAHPDIAALTDFVGACRIACGDRILKVILESGAFETLRTLEAAAKAAIAGGANFLKTSTGKIAVGATSEAVQTLITVIADHHAKTGQWIGLKVSGGVRTIAEANHYLALLTKALGKTPTPACFRIGASALLDAVLAERVSNSTS